MEIFASVERGRPALLGPAPPAGPDASSVRAEGDALVVETDPWGASPLWWSSGDGGVVVARTGRAAAAWSRSRAVVPGTVAAVLAGLPRWEDPFVEGTARLPRGAVVRLAHGREERAPAPAEPSPPSLVEALVEAIRRRLDPRVVCALSGGLDSAGLLALAARLLGRAPSAFTLSDGDGADPELQRARVTAAHVGAELVEVMVPPGDLPAAFACAVRAADAVVWDPRGVSKFLFWKEIRAAGAVAALSGVGADEVLLGAPLAMRVVRGRAAFDRALDRERHVGLQLLRPGAPLGLPPPVRGRREALRLAQERVLPLSTLPVERASGAAAGIDVRLPYLDRAVVAFAERQPTASLVRGESGKRPLRRLLRGLVPEEVRVAPKEPRLLGGGPAGAWLPALEPHLRPPELERLRVVDPGRVRALVDQVARARCSEERALGLRVLMKVASLVILTD
jgi:asparagine synthase (glutamine-hydrolysing)